MRSLMSCAQRGARQLTTSYSRRVLSTALPGSSSSPSPSPSPLPWFVDPAEAQPTSTGHVRTTLSRSPLESLAPLPEGVPADSPIARLYAVLSTSPYLEPGVLRVREPVPTSEGPPLPHSVPKGKRKRGRTNAGEGVLDFPGGLWTWIVVAQVKEGTENRGAIESVAKIVRKSLLSEQPPLPLPLNSRRRATDGWAMIDAGEFAVHIVSKEARLKFFPDGKREWS